MNELIGYALNLLDTDGFMPRWNCGQWSDAQGWLHIGSDIAIWAAYTAIPVVILYFVLKRRDIPFTGIFWLFGAFILACGSGHLIEAIIFWQPVYRLSGVVKFLTAAVSWATVVALVRITPEAMKLPGLAALNRELTKEIHERRSAESERERLLDSERAARGDAERANRIKDEFLSLVSHELRTPLNAILGYAQLLRRHGASPQEAVEAAQVIERNGRAQAQIIEDLLDMSRIISGKMRLDVQGIDLADVVQAAVETVRHSAEAKDIRLHVVLDPRAGQVLGDASRLQQVVWNLLANAIKFTPKQGKVQVLLERVNSHLELHVSDTGAGIKPEFVPYVFDRFRQQDSTFSREFGGLGLGLSIVKHLVEQHGGSVSVASAGEGQGATFTVSLPLRIVRVGDGPDARIHPAAQGDSAVSGATDILSGLRVLVVDDEADARTLLERLLTECGVQVTTAEGAAAALPLVRQLKPDVILSDIGMPHTDGYEFVRQLRALGDDEGGKTPAAAVTAFARTEDRTRALLAGFQAHVTKPIDSRELVAVLAALSGRTRYGR